jgi:hypothetical protein
MKLQKKVIDERELKSDYDISIAIPFPANTKSKPQKNDPINGHALGAGN